MKPSEKLIELGIELPQVAAPLAAYVPAQKIGVQVRTSGQLPFVSGQLPLTGKVGAEVSPEQAQKLARIAALNALAAAAAAAGGIDQILQISHLTGFVASAPDFYAQPAVVNGASLLLQEIFAERGRHTRSAVGVSVLPLDSPVEIELSCVVA
ncbi:RidA family protein [Arcanobacterium hippocoleae]|uniref:Enamine deaminase RidA (YjgF/YER057c/UK114 family) n=1 Tax=Arcanobacterium hippocoleae TaxID=149017 RepID=A0ABU1T241_9ACTO|nr:RidA family protein [Arcanobacterium hippocoleae]MDR6939364.1 enamine deaminase RidA (YjgF/YER057c/UK114 family) [Arcanobacterium hippocoleae]